MTPRIYRVADLILPPNCLRDAPMNCLRDAPMKVNMKSLIDVITTHIAPGTWEEDVGGIGSITPDPEVMSLVIRHNRGVQDQVGTLLDSLRRLQAARAVRVGMVSKEASPVTKPEGRR